MAGKIAINTLQLGDSATATNNFVLQTNLDGTAKIARGNAGATTQDILTVDAAGKVDLPQLVRSLGVTGSYTLPGELIIKWGYTTTSAGSVTITFAVPFPTAPFSAVASAQNAANVVAVVNSFSVSTMTLYTHTGNTGSAAVANVYWIAIGT